MSNDKPIIAVVGGVSKQGRSVVNSLLESGRYEVRALTSRMDSTEAKRLEQRGAKLQFAPLGRGSKADYVEAFTGAHGVFLVTPGSVPPETTEFQIGVEIADAAVAAGVEHIVTSALEDVYAITSGKIKARHFTDKARLAEYVGSLPAISTSIELAFFFTNLLEYYPPRLSGDKLLFPIYLPENFRAPFVDPLTATGPAVREIFDNPARYRGKTLPVIGDIVSPAEMVQTFTRVTGRDAAYVPAYSYKDFAENYPHFDHEFIEETMEMVQYAVEYGYFRGDRDLEWSRHVNPGALTWEQFLKKNRMGRDSNHLRRIDFLLLIS